MEKLKYTIEDSTIAELLGVQNFSTDEAAILELVKNAYDAKAIDLKIVFNENSLSIIDDGEGMDINDIKEHWMHVGKSNKDYEVIDHNNRIRILAGSKGVGRFALARLGRIVEIESKKSNAKGVIWKTDWNTSTLEETDTKRHKGTTIIIHDLRDKWSNKRIENLIKYLERTYKDNAMEIQVLYSQNEAYVKDYFPEAKTGLNCRSNIILKYEDGVLKTTVYADEFNDEAKKYCGDIDIHHYTSQIKMENELKGSNIPETDDELIGKQLLELGDFTANLFFNLNSNNEDKDKFLYKYTKTLESVNEGIILYRNAFSIASFDGEKDWLGLGKRSRKSPAAASHPTGAWRVRENQMAGFVLIDKKRNKVLSDLANRQGLDENVYYKLFVEVILTGIKEFERYRQSIIRKINVKNAEVKEEPTPVLKKAIKSPSFILNLSRPDAEQLITEIKYLQNEGKQAKDAKEEVEARYKYDVRILNVLATTGLKASSIAHEWKNDRNVLDETYDHIVQALKTYDMWDKLNEPENTRKVYRNIPYLLNQNQTLSKKLVSFMDTMLTEIEKKQFYVKEQNIQELVEQICDIWRRDYGRIQINIDVNASLKHTISEDTMQVILDNLILNSIQQNEDLDSLQININIEKRNGMLFVHYHDSGHGLDAKYANNPMKILEVHETTRANGHGLGMWIVNNTVVMSGGEIIEIRNNMGFEIHLVLGDNYNG